MKKTFLTLFLIANLVNGFSQKLTSDIEEAYHSHNYQKTVNLINQEISKSGQNRDLLELRAMCFKNLGKFDIALKDYTEVINHHIEEEGFFSTNSDLYTFRGQIYMQLKKYNRALEDFELALKIGEKEPFSFSYPDLLYLAKGETYLLIGEYELAIEELTKVLNKFDNHLNALHLRMIAFFKMGDTEKGCKDLVAAKKSGIKDELINEYIPLCTRSGKK